MKSIALLFFLLCYVTHSYAKTFQLWNSNTIHIRLTQQLSVTGQTMFRRKNNQLYYTHYQGQVYFGTSHILLAPGYRYIRHLKDGLWTYKHYSLLDSTIRMNTGSWSLSNRFRILHRMAPKCTKSKKWLYCNRIELSFSSYLLWHNITPYVSEEFFWGSTRHISQNRIIFGIRIPYHQSTQFDLYYMLRLKKITEHWVNQNIVGINLAFYF